MSRRKIEMTQEQLHHITHCSPCFQTFLSIREEIRKRRAVRFRIAAAAGAAVIAVGVFVYRAAVRSTAPRELAVPHHVSYARPPSPERISRNRLEPCQ